MRLSNQFFLLAAASRQTHANARARAHTQRDHNRWGRGLKRTGLQFYIVFHSTETIYILLLYQHTIMPSLKKMRSSGCVLRAPSRAVLLILHQPDVKGEIAIDWLAFKWTPSAYQWKLGLLSLNKHTHTETQRAGKRERDAHAAVQAICFDYLVRNGNT